jgi:triosephosphate isomerase (TIM)
MRTPLVVGNWKMHESIKQAEKLVVQLKKFLGKEIKHNQPIVICPPFTALEEVHKRIKNTTLQLGAQNMHHESEGAYTGAIAPRMLKEVGCKYVILGHSERRRYFHETNLDVNRKVHTALQYKFIPIICVGETSWDRQHHKQNRVIAKQMSACLWGVDVNDAHKLVIAYEPLWAIGTQHTATPAQAQEMHAFIRKKLKNKYGTRTANKIKILYGGSVNPKNVISLVTQPDIDGVLVGGASLKPRSFAAIVKNVAVLNKK